MYIRTHPNRLWQGMMPVNDHLQGGFVNEGMYDAL